MVSQSRSINLVNKLNPDVFKVLNQDVFGTVPIPLGTTQGAVSRIISPEYADMLKHLMPTIISTNPDDPTWYKRVKNYWDSFGIKVPIGGVKLEIGFTFDLNNSIRKSNIASLITVAGKKNEVIDSDDTLMKYVLKNIPEMDKYKYGTPINVENYLTWVFLLGHSKVAKEPIADALRKTTNIEFVLIDPKDIEDTRRANHTMSVEATKKYLEIITDRPTVKDLLYIEGVDASALDDVDADARLKQLVDTNPKKFLSIANDSTMKVKARIERYCVAGILKRLSNSSIVVDGSDNGIVIGNTIEEAVVYFMSEAPDKVARVKEFKTRYAQLKKN